MVFSDAASQTGVLADVQVLLFCVDWWGYDVFFKKRARRRRICSDEGSIAVSDFLIDTFFMPLFFLGNTDIGQTLLLSAYLV